MYSIAPLKSNDFNTGDTGASVVSSDPMPSILAIANGNLSRTKNRAHVPN